MTPWWYRHAADIEQRREYHPDFDRDREIREHRQRERRDPDADIRPGLRSSMGISRHSPMWAATMKESPRGPPLVRARPARADDQHHASVMRVDHSGDRRACARSDVGRRAGDRAGRGQPAEHRRQDVGHALPTSSTLDCVDRRSSGPRPLRTSATRSRRASRR